MGLTLPANTSVNHPPDSALRRPLPMMSLSKVRGNIADSFIKNMFILKRNVQMLLKAQLDGRVT